MKTNTMTRKAIACAMALASATSFAADIAVGKWERQTIDDGTQSIGAGEGLYLCEKAASLSYTGTGAWTLPLGNVFAFGNAEIGVRNGTLRLTGSAAPDLVANPPLTELNKAALWLDAGTNVKTEVISSKPYATGWYDARETSVGAPSYGYACVDGSTSTDNPQLSTVDNKDCVNFRGYKTGTARSFVYKTSTGEAETYNVRHAFFVMTGHPNQNTIGTVLAHTTYLHFYTDGNSLLATNGVASQVAYASEYYLDGVPSDPTASIVASETHLHEFALPPNRTIPVNALIRNRDAGSGGLQMHELLIFTDPLTVAERMHIAAYLKAKWSCGGASSLSVQPVADAFVEVADGVSLDSVEISGKGAVAIGSDTVREAAHLYVDSEKRRAPYAIKDASSLELQAAEYEYRLTSGENLTVNSGSDKAVALTKNNSGAPGNASVSSARQFVVSALDPEITSLTLSGGGNLVLRAPSTDSAYAAGTSSSAVFGGTSLSVPAGQTGVGTTVDVPAAGDWELSFKISNELSGTDSNAGTAVYRIQLKDGDSVVWERRPTAVSTSAYNNADQVKRYLVRNLAAGSYTFYAAGVSSGAIAAAIEDLSMKFVPNPANETVVPVTDGDFESSRFKKAFYATYDNNEHVDDKSPTQWTLTNGGLAADPPLQTIVSSAMGYSGNYDFIFRSSQLGQYGDNALVWYHNTSTATSPATTLPAGTYKLRLDAVRWMTGNNSHNRVGSGQAGRCNNPATLTASVSVNGGEAVSLGTIGPISNFTAETIAFPNSFTVSEGNSAVVTLGQTSANAAVQLDNLEFVKVEDDAATTLGAELVADGSCESGTSSSWMFDIYSADGYNHLAKIVDPSSSSGDFRYDGMTRCDGTYAIRTANGGRAYQTITMPAGTFRLSWWSRARWSDGKVSNPTTLRFWYAADGAATTNEIATSETSWCTNFLEHVAYFNVPTAGNYVFGFNSECANGKDAVVDCVSIRQVLGAEATPDIHENAEIKVSGGGKLRLDYNGCLKLGRLRVNGKSFMGEVSAEKYPDYISGPGRALVKERGFIMTFR